MKINQITQGPITLTKVDVAKNMSEETIAFTGEIQIEIDGKVEKSHVYNKGHGGPNEIVVRKVLDAVDAYAVTLPPIEFPGHDSIPMTTDCLVSEMVQDALVADELKKACSKKVLFQKANDSRVYMSKKQRGVPYGQFRDSVIEHCQAVTILNDLPEAEALEIWKATC